MRGQDVFWYWLNNLPGVGRHTVRNLLKIYEYPETIFYANADNVCAHISREEGKAAFAAAERDLARTEQEMETLRRKGIHFIHPQSDRYPKRLQWIPDPPLALYCKGRLPDEERRAIAIIGARSCSRYGTEMARFFARELAECGIDVISGLARGIDAMAHTGALEANGYTLGVLGCGIDVVYPAENGKLFAQMAECGGILSESNVGVRPYGALFPQRNRLIAGMADGILVVEATERSGTFITVDQGLEQGKEIFALPGKLTDAKSMGCNRLIKMGAHVVTEVSDILEILHVSPENHAFSNTMEEVTVRQKKNLLAPNEKMVYSCLQIEPKYLDDIIYEAGIAPQDVCKILNKLAVDGQIVEYSRNYYAIKL